jgi:hypothetical protein
MKYLVSVLVAVGLAVVPALATAQDSDGKIRKVDGNSKVHSKVDNTDKSKDIAASKADAHAKANNAATLSNTNTSTNKQAQAQAAKAKATSTNLNANIVKIGDINNTNYNENKQNFAIGVPAPVK